MLLKHMAGEHLRGFKLDGMYTLRELIGSGGSADVVRAYEPLKERTVAIKILNPIEPPKDATHPPKDPIDKARDEFANQSRVDNLHVLPVYRMHVANVRQPWGDLQPRPYITMEDGLYSLRARMNTGSLLVAESVNVLTQLANGLQAAHEHEMVHGDVKPANAIYRNPEYLPDRGLGENQLILALSDFGSALRGHTGKYPFTEQIDPEGTLGYTAPEQLTGHAIYASDIFAWGALAYELLTGEKPFKGDTPVQMMYATAYTPARRFSSIDGLIVTKTLGAIEEVVQETLNKDPNRRPQSAGESREKLLIAFGRGQAAERRDETIIDLTIPLRRTRGQAPIDLRELLGQGNNILSVAIRSEAEYRRNRRIHIGDVEYADNNTIFPTKSPRLFIKVDRNTSLPPVSDERRARAVLRLENLRGELADTNKDPFIPGLTLIDRSDEVDRDEDRIYYFEMADYDPYAPVAKIVTDKKRQEIAKKLEAAGAQKFAEEVAAVKKMTVDSLMKMAGKYLTYTVTPNGKAPFQPYSLADLRREGLLQNDKFLGEDSTYAAVAYFLAAEIYGKENIEVLNGYKLTQTTNYIDKNPHTQIAVQDPDSGQISILDIPQLPVN
jgi:serine/threonine protein kinase